MNEDLGRPARPWDLLNNNIGRVAQSVTDARMQVCNNCEFFYQTSQICKKCGCIMPLKTKLPNAECPVGKWGRAPRVDLNTNLE